MSIIKIRLLSKHRHKYFCFRLFGFRLCSKIDILCFRFRCYSCCCLFLKVSFSTTSHNIGKISLRLINGDMICWNDSQRRSKGKWGETVFRGEKKKQICWSANRNGAVVPKNHQDLLWLWYELLYDKSCFDVNTDDEKGTWKCSKIAVFIHVNNPKNISSLFCIYVNCRRDSQRERKFKER